MDTVAGRFGMAVPGDIIWPALAFLPPYPWPRDKRFVNGAVRQSTMELDHGMPELMGLAKSLFQNCSSRRQEALIYSKTSRNLSLLTSAATRKVIFKTRSN